MSLNDLANIGQVIGAIAVVISLIYVAFQIRQNTNAVRSATAQSVHEHFGNWYHMFGDEFRRYIEDEVMKKKPHPDAKPMGVFSLREEILARESHEAR